MNSKSRKAVSMLMLLMAAFIWGTSFIAQILGMEFIGPYTFLASRYFVSLLFLLPFSLVIQRYRAKSLSPQERQSGWRSCLKGGVICGIFLFTASALQQTGLLFTTAGKAGFITAAYIVIVPVYGLFTGKLPSKITMLTILLSMTGLYLLSIKKGSPINIGDMLVFAGAFFWAAHIMACDRFAGHNDPLKISLLQFCTVTVLAAAAMFAFEAPELKLIIASWKPVLYAGILCTGVAYTLQMFAQRNVSPVATCIILSSETLFAVASGYLVLGERLTEREFIGGAILLAATVMAQVIEVRSPDDPAL